MKGQQSAVEVYDKPDSIEVSQGVKGDYSFKVKLYFDNEGTKHEEVIKKIEDIYSILHKKFKS